MTGLLLAMKLGDLLGAAAGAYRDLVISDLTLDSREVTPGAAFVALGGERTHGLAYATEALERGAVVILYEPSPALPAPDRGLAVADLRARLGDLARRFFGRDHVVSLFGVTGTNGKTTVAYLVAQAMLKLGHRCAYLGTLGYGVPPALEPQPLTTPDCLGLHRRLRSLATDFAALEVSSHALAQERIAGLDFAVTALTNLSRDHLDAHGHMAAYAAAKRRLFEEPRKSRAVLNLDDAFGAQLHAELGEAERYGVSLRDAPEAVLHGQVESSSHAGLVLSARRDGAVAVIRSRLIGEFNAENLLVALGALLAWGESLDGACTALADCDPAPGRMELLPTSRDRPTVVVDYAHTPTALERVLGALRGLTAGELWVVFGCGGDRDRGKRPLMGRAAARYADRIVLTDDNPRSEDPAAIIAAIRSGIPHERDVVVLHDRGAAIRQALDGAGAEDLVLIAGKGHETTQTGANGVRYFSDRETALEVLEAGT